MTEVLNAVKIFILISFIMFIIRGIVKNAHIRTKGLVFFLVSLSLLFIFVIAFFVDRQLNSQLLNNPLIYIYFIGSCLVYTIYGLIKLCKSKKFAIPKKKQMIYTYHLKDEYVYIVYKHATLLYLVKDVHAGVKYTMKKTEFADDVVVKINQGLQIKTSAEVERNGMITKKGESRDAVYYCYIIEVDEPINNSKFECINKYDITTLPMQQLDQIIIYHLIMGTTFDETIS